MLKCSFVSEALHIPLQIPEWTELEVMAANGGGSDGTVQVEDAGQIPELRALLGVGYPFTMRELDKGRKRATLAAHPDKGGSAEKLQLVLLAHKALEDVTLRILAVQGRLRLTTEEDLDDQRMRGAITIDLMAMGAGHPRATPDKAPPKERKRLVNKVVKANGAKTGHEDGAGETAGKAAEANEKMATAGGQALLSSHEPSTLTVDEVASRVKEELAAEAPQGMPDETMREQQAAVMVTATNRQPWKVAEEPAPATACLAKPPAGENGDEAEPVQEEKPLSEQHEEAAEDQAAPEKSEEKKPTKDDEDEAIPPVDENGANAALWKALMAKSTPLCEMEESQGVAEKDEDQEQGPENDAEQGVFSLLSYLWAGAQAIMQLGCPCCLGRGKRGSGSNCSGEAEATLGFARSASEEVAEHVKGDTEQDERLKMDWQEAQQSSERLRMPTAQSMEKLQSLREQVKSGWMSKVDSTASSASSRLSETTQDTEASWDRFGACVRDMPLLSAFFDNPGLKHLHGESEIAATIRVMQRIDPTFRLEGFRKDIETLVVPHIIKSYLKGDSEALEMLCGQAAFAAVNASIKARKQQELFLSTATLAGPRELELAGAKSMEQGSPCFIWTFNMQQVNCLRNNAGEIIEGAVDDIRTVSYAMAVTRHPDADSRSGLECPWQVSELAILGNQPCF